MITTLKLSYIFYICIMGMVLTFIVFLILSEVLHRVPNLIWKIIGVVFLIYIFWEVFIPVSFVLLGCLIFVIIAKYIRNKLL